MLVRMKPAEAYVATEWARKVISAVCTLILGWKPFNNLNRAVTIDGKTGNHDVCTTKTIGVMQPLII